jgi:hypothetical protein
VTSNVTYAGINTNFPVAGQDNDTKVFRDNFATIKTGLENANIELSALQGTGENYSGAANRETANDFNTNTISNAVLLTVRDKKFDGGPYGGLVPGYQGGNISFTSGSYQVWQFAQSWTGAQAIQLVDFPGAVGDTSSSVGKVRLELYSANSESKTISFIVQNGTTIKRLGFPSGPGPIISDPIYPITVNVVIPSNTNPIVIDVWRHSSELVFFHYIGQFS